MTKKILVFVKRSISVLGSFNIHLGRDPRRVPAPSIIIFPYIPNVISCGLTGILTIKGKNKNKNGFDPLRILDDCLRSAMRCGAEIVIGGDVPAEEYMAGDSVVARMSDAVLNLKNDDVLGDMAFDPVSRNKLRELSGRINDFIAAEEKILEKGAGTLASGEMELINSCLEVMKDNAWAIERDILDTFDEIEYISGPGGLAGLSKSAFIRYKKMNFLLKSLDRLEVRGRDSSGVQVTFSMADEKELDIFLEGLKEAGLVEDFEVRTAPQDLLDGTILLSRRTGKNQGPSLSFAYKKASVTGKLGENGHYLRERVRSDEILHRFMREEIVSDSYLGHTRWASVGSIIEENCHPVNSHTLNAESDSSSSFLPSLKDYPFYGKGKWHISAALNGDIDNYLVLRKQLEESHGESIEHRVTTDTKIIPLQVEHYLRKGYDLLESFRLALNDFEGSHAIALQSNLEPGRVYVAQRGSGQSLYIGIADDQYVFASEVYGVVERTGRFVKLDGECERVPGDSSSKGQIFVLKEDVDEPLPGMTTIYYDGFPVKSADMKVREADITTRDIDRKDFPHFLFKEILESPLSVRKTLRGKYAFSEKEDKIQDVVFNIGGDIVPDRLRIALKSGAISNIYVVGQGTAAVAGAAIAEALSFYLKQKPIKVEARKATDLSGFLLRDDMSDTLVIAVTQSGTTTDTNRAVSMVKERGVSVISIVNRRQSDITHKVDGVFYTSDGRDIEMSVASTKAFYSQVVAGYILALFFAKILDTVSDNAIIDDLKALEDLPMTMERLIESHSSIRASAWEVVKKKKYWAVVGSGPNKIASDEIRIKLSELCYKTISSDIIEDKKHIDLSSEPLILVCAAGNPEPVIEDIVKDVAIFKAHAASVVVITEEGETRFDDIADSLIKVPPSTYPASVIINTLAGHLWGYYAACSIDEEATILRQFRTTLADRTLRLDEKDLSLFDAIGDYDLHRDIHQFVECFNRRRALGYYSSLSVDVATDLALLFLYASGKLPLEDFWREFEGKRISSSPIDMLDITLGKAIDELARPIDAIRHQAKTVTVGTSRKEKPLRGMLFDLLMKLDFSLENLKSKDGIGIRKIQKVVNRVRGYTLYQIDGLNDEGKPVDTTTISILKRDGISLDMKSRVEKPRVLTGTKRTMLESGDIYAGTGKSDGQPIVIIPLGGKDCRKANILLVHVVFNELPDAATVRDVMGDKWNILRDIFDEYNIQWKDQYLNKMPLKFILGESPDRIAARIIDEIRP